MRELTKCSPTDLRNIARGRLGLIIGPAATRSDETWSADLSRNLRHQFRTENDAALPLNDLAEALVEGGANVDEIRSQFAKAASQATPSPSLRALAKIRWSAVLSLSFDRCLEDALFARSSSQPGAPDTTVIVDLFDNAAEHTLPAYKLVGQWDRGQIVATHSDLLRRLPLWARAVQAFLDRVKASPILCMGLEDSSALLEHVVAHLVAIPAKRPAKLVFLADDPVVQNSRLFQIVPESMIVLAEGGLREICDAIEPRKRNLQLSLRLDGTEERHRQLDLSEAAALVEFVSTTGEAVVGETARLLDLLFMPDFSNWEPYLADLDFPRAITTRIVKSIKTEAADSDGSAMVLAVGSAGSGKTVILRRAAFDLARDGYHVAWLKRYWHSDAEYLLGRFFAQLSTVFGEQALILVVDDSSRLGALRLPDVVAMAERHRIRVVFLASMRTSESQRWDHNRFCEVTREHIIADDFEDGELDQFCAYVARIGVSKSAAEAKATLAESGVPLPDTLSALYYLVPSTRQSLALSVQDEYLRLGEQSGIERVLAGAFENSPKRLQDAYAMAATSFKYGAPLPVEVLVTALDVSYTEWFAEFERSATGILYPDEASDLESTCYQPRNELVARFILKLLNAGTFSRDGEVAVLRRLLGSCSGSGSVYREYCRSVLTPADKLDDLTPLQGLSLYDAALSALPEHSNRWLLHQKAVWVRNKLKDPDSAIALCNTALSIAPEGGDDEPSQLIHTSIAAALFQKIENGSLALDEGKLLVMRELEQSKDVQFVNAHSTHVYARLLTQLASRHAPESEADKLFLLNSAIAEIDRTVLLLRHSRLRVERRAKELYVLEVEKDRILLKAGTQEQIDERAEYLWKEHRNQSGLSLAIRKRSSELLGSANSGVKYNLAYQRWKEYVELVGGIESLSPELSEVGLTLYYDWQVHPRSTHNKRPASSPLDWQTVESCARIASTAERYRDDALYMYMRGLALAQLDKWTEADLVFERIRRLRLSAPVLHLPRDYLLGPLGLPRKVQGKVKPGATEAFFVADDIDRSWRVDRASRWKSGEIQHAFVYFSFAGPRATLDEQIVSST